MKKIAIIYASSNERTDYIEEILRDKYEILPWTTPDAVSENLPKLFDDIVALIIDNPSSWIRIDELVEYIRGRNNYMFSLPVLILTDAAHMAQDDVYLGGSCVGLISTNDTKKVILSRIVNTIRYCNSTSFEEFSNMLTELPSLIYLKDDQGRYAFCSKHWHHLKTEYKDIRGKTDFDIRKDMANAEIARNADLEVIESGQGKHYIIKECQGDCVDYLQVIKEPLKDKDGKVYGIIAVVNNVTEEELLRQQLREKSITDQLTGLYNRYYFDELANSKENRLERPYSILSADCDDLKQINDQFGHAAGDQYICFARDVLKDCLPENAVLFRMGGDEFLAVMPNTDTTEAQEIMAKINANIPRYRNAQFALRMSTGIYTATADNDTVENAVLQSDKAMYKVKKYHKTKHDG